MPWTDEDIRQLYREATTGLGGCPPADTLARALHGGLIRSEAEAVADHLAECADCAEDAQALRGLEPWAERAALSGGPARQTIPPGRRRPWFRQPLAGVAAALLVSTLALSAGLWKVRGDAARVAATLEDVRAEGQHREEALRDEIAQLRDRSAAATATPASGAPAPDGFANVPILDLLPAGAARGAASAAVVPRGAPLVVCVLTVPSDTPAWRGYAVEVRGGGLLTWRGDALVRSREDTFTLALPVRVLARGENRIRLVGTTGARSALVEEYLLRLP